MSRREGGRKGARKEERKEGKTLEWKKKYDGEKEETYMAQGMVYILGYVSSFLFSYHWSVYLAFWSCVGLPQDDLCEAGHIS